MDGPVDDEKKPFDAETTNDDDAQPDPDEHLMLDQGSGRVWLVKVLSCSLELKDCTHLITPFRFPSSFWNVGLR
jgi:hypothetical protein